MASLSKEYDIHGRLMVIGGKDTKCFYTSIIYLIIISFFIVDKLQSNANIIYKLIKTILPAEQRSSQIP